MKYKKRHLMEEVNDTIVRYKRYHLVMNQLIEHILDHSRNSLHLPLYRTKVSIVNNNDNNKAFSPS
jgi:hypothetical protein